LNLSTHRQKKGSKVWSKDKRRMLVRMSGYFNKDEMAERLGLEVSQVVEMCNRIGASHRVTKNLEDYVE